MTPALVQRGCVVSGCCKTASVNTMAETPRLMVRKVSSAGTADRPAIKTAAAAIQPRILLAMMIDAAKAEPLSASLRRIR